MRGGRLRETHASGKVAGFAQIPEPEPTVADTSLGCVEVDDITRSFAKSLVFACDSEWEDARAAAAKLGGKYCPTEDQGAIAEDIAASMRRNVTRTSSGVGVVDESYVLEQASHGNSVDESEREEIAYYSRKFSSSSSSSAASLGAVADHGSKKRATSGNNHGATLGDALPGERRHKRAKGGSSGAPSTRPSGSGAPIDPVVRQGNLRISMA